jgi:hypothetical protein
MVMYFSEEDLGEQACEEITSYGYRQPDVISSWTYSRDCKSHDDKRSEFFGTT